MGPVIQQTENQPGSFPYLSVIIFIIASALLLYLSIQPKLDIVVFSLVLFVPLIYLILNYPKFWLWTIALSSFLFFRSGEVEVTLMDVFFGFYFIGTTVIWLLWMIFVKHEKVVDSLADWLILFFFIAAIFTVFISLLNDVSFLEWFREYALFLNILLYFPIKHFMKSRRDLMWLLIFFSVSIIISSIDQFRSYKEIALSQSEYAYQLSSSVRLNQTLFSAGIFFSLAISLLPVHKLTRIILWGFTATCTAALMVSFSRSFWIFVFVGILLMFFLVRNRQKSVLIIGVILISIAGSLVFTTVFKEKTKIMTRVVENRLMSSTQGKKDISVNMRLVEYNIALKKIAENPMYGNGLGKRFEIYDMGLHFSTMPKNIHNGYLFTIYRFGIPLAIIYFIILFWKLFKGFNQTITLEDKTDRILSLASTTTILMVMVASIASNQFFGRDGSMVLAVSIAVISIAGNHSKELPV